MDERSFAKAYKDTIAACTDEYGAHFRKLGWGTMTYACVGHSPGPGSRGCGFEHRVWLGLGVEGPPAIKRDRNIWVPAPFYCGRCPDCEGSLVHERWHDDEEFEPKPIPDDAARFTVPSSGKAKRYARENYGGAEYEDPSGRTTRRRMR